MLRSANGPPVSSTDLRVIEGQMLIVPPQYVRITVQTVMRGVVSFCSPHLSGSQSDPLQIFLMNMLVRELSDGVKMELLVSLIRMACKTSPSPFGTRKSEITCLYCATPYSH